MHLLLSIALVVGAAFGSAWLVDGWLGEARRFWVGVVGVGLMVGGGALVQASGIAELTRVLRNAVVRAGIGAAQARAGVRLGWLRRGLRRVGVETGATAADVPVVSRFGGWLLTLAGPGRWSGWGWSGRGCAGGDPNRRTGKNPKPSTIVPIWPDLVRDMPLALPPGETTCAR